MRAEGDHRRGVGAGIVAVLAGLGVGAVVIAMATASGERVAAAQNAAKGGTADAGMAAFMAQAAQGLVTPPDIEDVEHMCALLTSCRDLPFPSQMLPNSVPTCVKSFMDSL